VIAVGDQDTLTIDVINTNTRHDCDTPSITVAVMVSLQYPYHVSIVFCGL
jgi:hypothetical protein